MPPLARALWLALVAGCGGLIDTPGKHSEAAAPSLDLPRLEIEQGGRGTGPGGCVEEGRTLIAERAEFRPPALRFESPSLYVAMELAGEATLSVFDDISQLDGVERQLGGLGARSLWLGSALLRVSTDGAAARFPRESSLSAQAAVLSPSAVHWLRPAEQRTELWTASPEGEEDERLVATLDFNATKLAAEDRELVAMGSGITAAPEGRGAVIDPGTGSRLRDLALVARGEPVGFSPQGPTFVLMSDRPRSGGEAYRYELWSSPPSSGAATRQWRGAAGQRPTEVWSVSGVTFLLGWFYVAAGDERQVLARIDGDRATPLVCLEEDLTFGPTTPIVLQDLVVAVVAPRGLRRGSSVVAFDLR